MPGSPVTEPAPATDTGRRLALVVAVTDYLDTSLRRLRAPAGDAAELRDILADPELGGFTVTSVINERAHQLRLAIEDFLADRRGDDLLLLYLSCHGLVDARRRLYFAARDTVKDRLASSGIESHWLLDQLEDCRARRQVVILDCCFSGAFARGSKGDDELGLAERLVGEGRGRVVLTASRGTEYSFEGEPLQGEDTARGSVFTSALIEGIRSGRADTDADGDISVEDAYAFAFEQVRRAGAQQTPQRWVYGAEGSILLSHAPRSAAAMQLPPAPDDEPASETPPPAAGVGPPPTPVTEPKKSGAPGPPPSLEPTPAGASRRPSRRTIAVAASAVGAVGIAVVAVLLTQGGGDNGSASSDSGVLGPGSTTGTFTRQSPWRVLLKDAISGNDNGCHITLTDAATGDLVREWTSFYGTQTFHMRDSGTFRWRVSDRECLVLPQTGEGKHTELPFTWTNQAGDTPLFESPGRLVVQRADPHDTSQCDLYILSAADQRILGTSTLQESQAAVPLESGGSPSSVYIAAPTCWIRVSAAH